MSPVPLVAMLAVVLASCGAEPPAGFPLPTSTNGEPWRPSDFVLTFRHETTADPGCHGDDCRDDAHWVLEVQRRDPAETIRLPWGDAAETRTRLEAMAAEVHDHWWWPFVTQTMFTVRAPESMPMQRLWPLAAMLGGRAHVDLAVNGTTASPKPELRPFSACFDGDTGKGRSDLEVAVHHDRTRGTREYELVWRTSEESVWSEVRERVGDGDRFVPRLAAYPRDLGVRSFVDCERATLQDIVDVIAAFRAAGYDDPELVRPLPK